MSYPFAELEQYSATLASYGYTSMTPPQLLAVDTLVPLSTLMPMAKAAFEGNADAVSKMVHLNELVLAHTLLTERQISIPMAFLSNKRKSDPPRFKALFTSLSIGNAEALAKVNEWAGPGAAPAQRFATPVHTAQAPVHPTSVEPPSDYANPEPDYSPEPVNYGRQDEGYRPDSAPRHAQEAQRQPSNVTPFPQREERTYDSVNVYGMKTALQFDHCPTPDRKSTTINISLAKATGDKCLNGINWSQKITIMLTPKEVALIASVMFGQLQTVRFAGHGANNEKWIEVAENTDPQYQGGIKVTMAMKSDIRNCTITYNDILDVMAIFNRALISQNPGATPISVGQLTQRASSLYTKALAAKAAR